VTRGDGEVVTTTERLTLRTFREDDLPAYAALNADPEVMAHLGGVLTREQSDEIAEWANHLWATEGIGLLAVERADDGTFLGMCGVHRLQTFPEDLEVGWRLAREHWGRGYASEAAAAWVRLAFDEKPVSRLLSVTEVDNVRSLAVMARLGFTFLQEADMVEHGDAFHAVVHVLDRATWLSRIPDERR
jgi:RimJ/RimL family protein N-acetyltransferase